MVTVIAMQTETCLLDEIQRENCIITGAGALNVINSLKGMDLDTPILNIGYAGSNSLPIGSRVRVGKVMLYHPNVDIDEPVYVLDGKINCYTSNDFVLSTEIREPCVFDMELAFIMALGFRNVISEKVVSDNLSLKEFSNTRSEWERWNGQGRESACKRN